MRARPAVAILLLSGVAAIGCRRKPPPPPPIIEGIYECVSDSDCVMNDFACCSDCRRPTAYSKKAFAEAKRSCQREDCEPFESTCPENLEKVDAFVAVCRAQKCVTERKKK